MPFRERCSHPPLPNRDLGKRRCTRTCLWAPILASRTNGLQRFHPKTLGIRGREDRGRITLPSSMAAVTTPTTQRRHRTHFRMTGSLLGCECFSTFVFNTSLSASEPLSVRGWERERENCELTVLSQGSARLWISAVRRKDFGGRLQSTSNESA